MTRQWWTRVRSAWVQERVRKWVPVRALVPVLVPVRMRMQVLSQRARVRARTVHRAGCEVAYGACWHLADWWGKPLPEQTSQRRPKNVW